MALFFPSSPERSTGGPALRRTTGRPGRPSRTPGRRCRAGRPARPARRCAGPACRRPAGTRARRRRACDALGIDDERLAAGERVEGRLRAPRGRSRRGARGSPRAPSRPSAGRRCRTARTWRSSARAAGRRDPRRTGRARSCGSPAIRAAPLRRQVLGAFAGEPEGGGQREAGDDAHGAVEPAVAGGVERHVLHVLAPSRARTISRAASTTWSMSRPDVSSSTASAARRSGATARCES